MDQITGLAKANWPAAVMVLLAVITLGWQSFSLHGQTKEILYTELRDIRGEISGINERMSRLETKVDGIDQRLIRMEGMVDSK